MEIFQRKWPKLVVGLVVCFFIRLLPFRPPNVEPLLAILMPFSKAYGAIIGFVFGFISIFFYDLVTAGIGVWTIGTAFLYGFIGFAATFYFQNKKSCSWNYVKFAFFSTILFDSLTGLTIGPIFFGQPFISALTGQIPFTVFHLLGNLGFAAVLSPMVYTILRRSTEMRNVSLLALLKNKRV